MRTHRASGWSRAYIPDGSGRQSIQPTDGTPQRIVRFLSAGSWSADPQDDKANQNSDRVIVLAGPPLPAWALAWLLAAGQREMERAREALRSAIEDADWHEAMRDADSY